jgi:hypothetical protein
MTIEIPKKQMPQRVLHLSFQSLLVQSLSLATLHLRHSICSQRKLTEGQRTTKATETVSPPRATIRPALLSDYVTDLPNNGDRALSV